jgi:GNAT superfamily N-acetyltransferase
VRVADEPFDAPDGVALRDALGAELRQRYAGPGVAEPAWEAAAFLVARDDRNAAVGCVALRRLEAERFELRRMYVRPAARGNGVADALLAAAETRAVQLGAGRLILQCGTAQPEAIAVYRRHGYVPIAPFGEYAQFESSRCFGRDLGDPRAAAPGNG